MLLWRGVLSNTPPVMSNIHGSPAARGWGDTEGVYKRRPWLLRSVDRPCPDLHSSVITRGCVSKGSDNNGGGPENRGVINKGCAMRNTRVCSYTILLSHYHTKAGGAMAHTCDPGERRQRSPRLAAIPQNIADRALICCCAGATFGSGLIGVNKRNRRRRRKR